MERRTDRGSTGSSVAAPPLLARRPVEPSGRDPPRAPPGRTSLRESTTSIPHDHHHTGRRRPMKRTLAVATALLLCLIDLPAIAAETLTLYDNFNSSIINYAKWTGSAYDVLELYKYIVFPA